MLNANFHFLFSLILPDGPIRPNIVDSDRPSMYQAFAKVWSIVTYCLIVDYCW